VRVVLSGGEKGSHRSILTSNGVQRIAVNLTQLAIPKTKELVLSDLLKGAKAYLYTSDGDEDVARYDEFIRAHEDELTVIIGRPDYDGEWLGDKYYPLWNDEKDMERLAHLMQKYGRVAISDNAISGKTIPRIKQLQLRWGASLIGITSKVDIIESIPWDTVIVSSWTSVVRYGETQIWDGHGLRRYPAQQKDSARKKHRADIVRLGVDFDAVVEDDVSELAKLAVRSWLEWEMHTYGKETPAAYDPLSDVDEDEFEEGSEGQVVAISPTAGVPANTDSGHSGIAIHVPETRHGEERKLLPVMGVETMIHTGSNIDGSTEIDPEPVRLIRSTGDVLRNCDSCYLAPRCPMFKEHAECAYKLPVELRTKDQLQAVIRAMIEMQTSRVLFARFAEELEGQGMDPTLSAEMDRLFRLIQQSKDISDTRDLVRIDIEARSSSGALSRIFGAKVGEQAKQLANPMTQGELDAAIIDAEVL
jgi:hypothetical protein